jgi:thioredoxin-related protein
MRRVLVALAAAVATLATAAGAVEVGDDGLYDAPWLVETFKDLREDLAEAGADGKRLMVIFEQRGCVYCRQMHEEVFPIPEIAAMLDNYFVVQMNLYGDTEVTDFDGEVLSEKAAARKWGVMFTPTMMFFPEEVPEGVSAPQAAVAVMPGAFGKGTTLDMLTWVAEDHSAEEDFQRYHSRMIQERGDGNFD